ncbi:MAG TPA: hypothetical protein VI386_13810, partial [Candidatus Sulfotelmatobacter sp.]
EHGFTGGYTIIKEYVREQQRRRREMFVPLHHEPGHAQADFGEALVVLCQEGARAPCCTRDEGGPFGAVL